MGSYQMKKLTLYATALADIPPLIRNISVCLASEPSTTTIHRRWLGGLEVLADRGWVVDGEGKGYEIRIRMFPINEMGIPQFRRY